MMKGYTDTDLGQLHYLSSGSKNSPPLVLLHDSPSSAEMFRKLMTILGQDFLVYAPDFPGFGGSDQIIDRVSVKGYAHVVASFMRAMNLPPCLVFGHHAGAAIAAQLGCSAPERVSKLVLSSPPCLSREEQQRLLGLLPNDQALDEEGEYFLRAWQRLRTKAEGIPLEISNRELYLELIAGELHGEVMSSVYSLNMRDCLKRLDQPTLVVCGRQDSMFFALDQAFSYLKRGKKIVLGDASAYACETHTPDLANIIFEFWRSLSSSKAEIEPIADAQKLGS